MSIELIEHAFYWVKPAYGADLAWTVARWQVGSFWGPDGREVTPRAISGPISPPAESGDAVLTEGLTPQSARDEQKPDPLQPQEPHS